MDQAEGFRQVRHTYRDRHADGRRYDLGAHVPRVRGGGSN